MLIATSRCTRFGKLNKSILFIVATTLLGSNVFAHGVNRPTSMKDIPHTTVTFAAGSWMLSDADKANLVRLITDSKNKGTIDLVAIAAWSDKALPAKGQKLLDQDSDLADKRATVISDFVKAQPEVTSVSTFNMAEGSNWLARTFNTKDAELKSVFAKRNEAPITNLEYKVIKNEGGPSEAVIVTEVKYSEPKYPK